MILSAYKYQVVSVAARGDASCAQHQLRRSSSSSVAVAEVVGDGSVPCDHERYNSKQLWAAPRIIISPRPDIKLKLSYCYSAELLYNFRKDVRCSG